MSLLSEQDIALAWIGINDPIALGGNFKDSEHVKNFAANLESAILAKLAAKELPEPATWGLRDFVTRSEKPLYTATHLQQAHAQGFAAGAAAQLAGKPSGYLSQHNLEMLRQGYPQTIVMLEGAKRDTPLYTRREA